MNLDRMEFMAWMKRIVERMDMLSEEINSSHQKADLLAGDQMLDNQDLMFMLKISSRSLQRYCTNNSLPYYSISGKIYYKLSDVRQFLRSRLQRKATGQKLPNRSPISP